MSTTLNEIEKTKKRKTSALVHVTDHYTVHTIWSIGGQVKTLKYRNSKGMQELTQNPHQI